MTDTEHLTTLEPGQRPMAKQLIRELQDAALSASGQGVFTKLLRCAETRRCEFPEKTADGRLPKVREIADEKRFLFRWPGAPNVSVPLADMMIRTLRMVRMAVFNRGDARISPERLVEDSQANTAATAVAGMWQTVTSYYLHKQDRMLAHAYGLFSTCVEELGYGILLIDWQKKRRLELKRMTLQQLTDAVVQERLATMVTPEDEALLVQLAEEAVQDLLSPGPVTPQHVALVQLVDPALLPEVAKKLVRALRELKDEDAASYTVPRDDGGQLVARALIPWVHCAHPQELAVEGACDWISYPDYLSHAQVLECAALEGWDEALVTTMLEQQANKFFHSGFGHISGEMPQWLCNGVGLGLVPDETALQSSPRYQIFRTYRRITNEDGLPMVYRAVFHPLMEDGLLLWEPTDMEDLSIIVETSEDAATAMQSRGVPDIVVDKQNFLKDSLDAEGARSQLGSNPPFVRNSPNHLGMRPGLELDGGKLRNDVTASRFVDVPPVDQGTFLLMDRLERMVRQYYYCDPTTDPDAKRLFQEDLSYRSLRCMVKLIRLVWRQIQENITELHVSTIAGRAVQLDVNSRDQLRGEADVHMGFHTDGLSKDASEKFFDILGKLVSTDRAGIVDWAEVTQIGIQLFAPTYARRIIVPTEQASKNILADQDARIAKIMAGVPMDYDERVSGPDMRMERMQQWLQNQENAALAQASPTRLELVKKELQWLQTRQQQQVENPVIGRTGVTPN
jgi:hypothetical protein